MEKEFTDDWTQHIKYNNLDKENTLNDTDYMIITNLKFMCLRYRSRTDEFLTTIEKIENDMRHGKLDCNHRDKLLKFLIYEQDSKIKWKFFYDVHDYYQKL